MKIGMILLARMGSTRLPGKVMKKLYNKTVLEHIIERLSHVDSSEKPVVATTVNQEDDVIEELCRNIDIPFFRGSENNILERCIKASEYYKFDAIIRLGADNPLVDFEVINTMVNIFKDELKKGNAVDYVSNTMYRSFPIGLDAEVMTLDLLNKIKQHIKDLSKKERELNESNVIPFLHQNRALFNTLSYREDRDYSHLRWTLDTPEDFALITKIYNAVYPLNSNFRMPEIIELLEKNPDWIKINADVKHVTGFWTKEELKRMKLHISDK